MIKCDVCKRKKDCPMRGWLTDRGLPATVATCSLFQRKLKDNVKEKDEKKT